MSSNRTIIPGMEAPYNGPDATSRFNGVSAPHANAVPAGGTCVPSGMPNQMGEPVYCQPAQKPVIGFLYSISKSGSGEFWPVHIGSNIIGRSAECDVCLQEGTVSDKHATLVVRVMKNPEKVIASICDSSSTIGTMINGESLGFEQRECYNGDIITVGAHYDLLFILIDAKQIGLKVCGEFIPVQPVKPNVFGAGVGHPAGMNPTVDLPGNNPYAPPSNPGVKRTRGYNDDGSMGAGATQGMPGQASPSDSDSQSHRTIFM